MSDENKAPNPFQWLWQRLWQWVHKRLGPRGGVALVLLAAAVMVWASSGWPGVSFVASSIMAWINRDPLPQVDSRRFSVAVAHLEDDDANRSHEKLIVRLLHDFEGVQVLAFDRTIQLHGSVPAEQERKGHETARQYLKESNASVLIWGRVLRFGDQSKPDLYLTAAVGQDGRSKQYTPETGTEFSLPKVFWDDLADVLRLVIVTQAAQFEEGHYVADRLQPFIARVRTLIDASADRPDWGAEARASARFALGWALATLGEQSGQAEPLKEAVTFYRAALKEWTRERVPLEWATVQNNLGNALSSLGERESGTARLEEAVNAFRAALEERTRERVPLDWAATQTDLGQYLFKNSSLSVG